MSSNVAGNMDDEATRKKMLADAIASDGTQSDSEVQVKNATPSASKVKGKNMAERFKRNASTTPKSNQGSGQNRNTSVQSPQSSNGAAVNSTNKITVEGTNIGSRAFEPDWSKEELQHIANLSSVVISTTMMAETRRSHPDPENKYLSIAPDGSVVTRAPAILPTIPWSEFRLGLGKIKPDEKTGKAKLYRIGNSQLVQSLQAVASDKAGGKIEYAFDCISEHNSFQNISQVLDQKWGRITLILPGRDFSAIPAGIKKSTTYVGAAHDAESVQKETGTKVGNEEFAYTFFRYFGSGLQKGFFKGHPYEVVPGGLGGVERGLSDLKAGRASAVKYVFRIEETEGSEKP